MSWVSLHTHSQFSILDAMPSVKALAKKAAEHGMPALALTDNGNMYGAIDFYQACKKEGVKPILGCQLYVAPRSRHEKKRVPGERVAYRLVLLAKDQVGYHNLCKLSSQGFLDGFYYYPRVDWELLEKHAEGLICLYGSDDVDRDTIGKFKNLYGDDLYLELQRQSMSEEQIEADGFLQESWLYQQYESFIAKQTATNTALVELGRELDIRLVASNDIHYIDRDDWRAHEVLLNVQSGEPCEVWQRDSLGNPTVRTPNPKRRTYSSHEGYFKSADQMKEVFSDLPEAVENTLEVANKCNLEIDFSAQHYPVFISPELEGTIYGEDERKRASEAFLRTMCEEAIPTRYSAETLEKVRERYPDKEPLDIVRARLKHELEVILPKGLGDYLLIVWDFIAWAKRQNIPVGPGRGSGAGSIVLYLIGITDIEPLRFNLFFERFINPERLSYPDIDVDICMDRRGEVIEYTVNKYGKECVAQIITFGTMKAKMAIKDVGRVLSVSLPKVNAIAKLVPDDLGMTISKALEIDADLYGMYTDDDEVKRLIDLAKRLEGTVRSTGIHAAGVIISGSPLINHIPVCVAKDSEMAVTQYSMKPVEKVGMLKIDFLGLKTLTSIDKAIAAVKKREGREISLASLPLDDRPTFDLLNQGKTLGVFQMESGGMQDLARQLHLDTFEEIIAVVALYRPGPMDMIPSFIERKHGREAIEYDHEQMQDILSETYGIMVYQEQVMQIAQKLGSYSLGEGDVLRRAMGKKIMEEMVQQREKFRLGAIGNAIDEATAVAVFDKMEQFAKYGFNKSHAAAYGFLTYVTAYLKANYPGEWMAALMTCDRDDTSKVARFIRECQSMGIAILPPDVNEAGDTFVATPSGIRFAMSGIKGVGRGVVEAIIEERERSGPFKSLHDFLSRIEGKKVGKRVVEILIDAGCFDFTGWTRDQLALVVGPMYDSAMKDQKEKAAGVMSLFSLMGEAENQAHTKPPEVKEPSTPAEIFMREKELLGFFLTGHPMDEYKPIMDRLSALPLSEVVDLDHDSVVRTAFVLDSVTVKISNKSQRKFAILNIGDGLETYELPVWADLYEEKAPLLVDNQLIYSVIHVERRDGSLRLNCKWLDDLTQVTERTILQCDEAYDKAKHTIAMRARQRKAAPEEKVEKVKAPEKLKIRLDMADVRLSHILKLKELLAAKRGKSPITLEFDASGRQVGHVSIPDTWGVTIDKTLCTKLEALPPVIETLVD